VVASVNGGHHHAYSAKSHTDVKQLPDPAAEFCGPGREAPRRPLDSAAGDEEYLAAESCDQAGSRKRNGTTISHRVHKKTGQSSGLRRLVVPAKDPARALVVSGETAVTPPQAVVSQPSSLVSHASGFQTAGSSNHVGAADLARRLEPAFKRRVAPTPCPAVLESSLVRPAFKQRAAPTRTSD